jgi:hypothetical protein
MQTKKGEDLNPKGRPRRGKLLRIAAGGALMRRWAAPSQPASSSRSAVQLVEQRFGIPQVGGVETLGKPIVDFGEGRARLVALALGGQ